MPNRSQELERDEAVTAVGTRVPVPPLFSHNYSSPNHVKPPLSCLSFLLYPTVTPGQSPNALPLHLMTCPVPLSPKVALTLAYPTRFRFWKGPDRTSPPLFSAFSLGSFPSLHSAGLVEMGLWWVWEELRQGLVCTPLLPVSLCAPLPGCRWASSNIT